MRDTKQKILDVSLDLFSQNGFSAVSIRDICRQVQIKESSVYYHFQNKQAIFQELLDRFQATAARLMSQLEKAQIDPAGFSQEDLFSTVCNHFFEKYLMDEFCNKIMRLLSIERFHSDDMQKIYDRWMFRVPLRFQAGMFSRLSEAGALPPADSGYLAVKFYAPIYFFSQRWLFCGTLTEECKQAFRTDTGRYLQKFFRELGNQRQH